MIDTTIRLKENENGAVGFMTASTRTVTAVAGVATFNNLILKFAGVYSLNAADGSLTPAVSGNLTIAPAG